MSLPLDADDARAATVAADVPRASRWEMVRGLFSGGSERIDMLSRLRRMHERYGPAVLLDLGLIKYVTLFGPDANRFVLLDKDRIFSARRPWMQIMGRIFPNGLLLRDGDEHKQHRKLMREAFTRPALREYGERMHPLIADGIANWGGAAGPFLAFPAYKELTLDIAARIFVGVELGPETTKMNGVFEDLVGCSHDFFHTRVRKLLPDRQAQQRR